jgi:hypothetical protein
MPLGDDQRVPGGYGERVSKSARQLVFSHHRDVRQLAE